MGIALGLICQGHGLKKNTCNDPGIKSQFMSYSFLKPKPQDSKLFVLINSLPLRPGVTKQKSLWETWNVILDGLDRFGRSYDCGQCRARVSRDDFAPLGATEAESVCRGLHPFSLSLSFIFVSVGSCSLSLISFTSVSQRRSLLYLSFLSLSLRPLISHGRSSRLSCSKFPRDSSWAYYDEVLQIFALDLKTVFCTAFCCLLYRLIYVPFGAYFCSLRLDSGSFSWTVLPMEGIWYKSNTGETRHVFSTRDGKIDFKLLGTVFGLEGISISLCGSFFPIDGSFLSDVLWTEIKNAEPKFRTAGTQENPVLVEGRPTAQAPSGN